MTRDRYQHAIRRGAIYNLLGGIARLGYPLFLMLVARLWGSAFSGLFLLAQALVEVVACTVIDGPADATVVFASRHVDGAADDERTRARLYHVLGTTARVALGLGVPLAVATVLLSGPLVRHFFPRYGELLPGLWLLAAALIPRAISQTAIAATKALLHMQYDALLNGFLYPVFLLAGGLATWALGGGLTALLGVQLLAECGLTVLALRVAARYFSLADVARALRLPADREVLRFVIPQGLNLTFNRYIARVDSIMLAAFGLGRSDLGFFSTAAMLTGLLAQIRMVFSGALAPVVARYHATGAREALEATMGRVARWSTGLAVPAVFIVLVFRADLLGLVSPDFRRTSLFVVVQLIPPFTSCAYGLAGASLMFTGHSRTTLANSISVAVFNTGLVVVLVPRYGPMGAAVATAIASSTMTALQMIELFWLERVAIRWRYVRLPHLGLAAGLLPLILLWDPARLSAAGRAGAAALACGIYATVELAGARLRRRQVLQPGG
ncbi:MAG: polysaccharide biosynthesis C-terminal domain-containing protein [Verrucomicrobiota bacterium]